jgi:hypothetical protein
VFIVAKQQTTNRGAFQNLVAEIKNDTITKDKTEPFVIQNIDVLKMVRSVNHTMIEKWRGSLPKVPEVIDLTAETPHIPANIVHKMHGHFCEGLHRKIHTVEIVTDMVAFNVSIIAKNKENVVIACMQTIDTDNPRFTIDWHTEMVKHIRHGGSKFTNLLNLECHRYYSQTDTKKSIEEKEVCEMPLPVPSTKAPRIQPLRSTRKLKSYAETDCNENDMKQTVPHFLPSELLKSLKKEKRKRKTRYTRGPYKKRKGV